MCAFSITKCVLLLNALLSVLFQSISNSIWLTNYSDVYISPWSKLWSSKLSFKNKWLFNVQKIITFLFSGIPYQQKSVQLKCVVECYPLCDLVWHRNNTPIPITNKRSLAGGIFQGSGQLDTYSRFTVQTEHKPANSVENVLEHVQSVLTLVST